MEYLALIFHLLSENIIESESLLGNDITNLIYYNSQLLHQRYKKNEVSIIDNISLLDSNEFINNVPNSHYHYNGRKLMAEKIAKFLQKKNN